MENSLQDITQLIRIKEKELHEIHDQRCQQLERQIGERDNLLIESSKRFEQLRDDFQYNLALLEARDQEIERLESHVKQITLELNDNNAERRALRGRIDILEIKETERFEKHEETKAANKRILRELKDVIESMRWAAAEETKVKEREIEALKEDLVRIHHSRDESLEAQRKDLTHTFETLLQQREDAFLHKEKDIAMQVGALEGKFEIIQTENSRLKAETTDLHRRIESMTTDLSGKDEHIRQLQWRLDDERTTKQQTDDQLQRRLHQTNTDLALTREKAIHDISDIQRQMDKLTIELEREKEFRDVTEKRLKEQQTSSQQEWTILSSEISESRKAETLTRKENQSLKEERDKYMEDRAIARAEVDALELRCKSYTADNESLKQELENLKSRLLEAELAFARTDAALTEAKRAAVETALASERRAAERVATIDQNRAAEMANSREQAIAEANERYQTMISQYETRLAEVEIRCLEACAERDECKGTLQQQVLAIDNERVESNALRLRLQLMETQMSELQQRLYHIQEDRRRDEGFLSGLVIGAGYDHHDPHMTGGVDSHGDMGMGMTSEKTRTLQGPSSPAFSEDFGPASLPDSPIHPTPPPSHLHTTKALRGGGNHSETMPPPPPLESTLSSGEGGGYGFYGFTNEQLHDNDRGNERKSDGKKGGRERDEREIPSTHGISGSGTQAAALLIEENERLKSIIKEMRADVEAMHRHSDSLARGDTYTHRDHHDIIDHQHQHRQPQPQPHLLPHTRSGSNDEYPSHDYASHDQQRVGQLETRLEQTMSEVTRLRNERKRLMEVGNELRAALNRQPLLDKDKDKDKGSYPSSSSSSTPSSSSSSSSSSSRPGHPMSTTISKDSKDSIPVAPVSHTRDVHMTRPPLNYPPALRATSHLGGTHYTVSSTQSHPSSSSSSSSSSSLGMEFGGGGGGGGGGIGIRGSGIQGQGLSAQGQGLVATQPMMTGTSAGTGTASGSGGSGVSGNGGTFSNTLPIALTNSDRTTLSQLKARQRIVEKQQSGPGPSRDTGPRRIYNYARGADGETDAAENATTGGAGGGGGGGGDGSD